jgi:hypothetical protein
VGRGLRGKVVAIGPGGHIRADELTGATAARDEIIGGFTAGERVAADIGEQHPEAVRGKTESDRPPDSGRRPGHHSGGRHPLSLGHVR